MRYRDYLSEALEMVKLSVIARDKDEELGTALAEAIREPSAWLRVHDRLCVLGDFGGADKIREMAKRNLLPSPMSGGNG